MIAVRVVVLLQGLLLAARADVRARDPELMKKQEEESKHTSIPHHDGLDHVVSHGDFGASHNRAETLPESTDVYGTIYPPQNHGHNEPNHEQHFQGLSEETEGASAETPIPSVTGRTGNWCAFVHKRLVSVVVSCGTEKYIIKSQNPCQNGAPDCHLIVYSLAIRPVYRQKQKIFSSLMWRCCPGHGGQNCEEIVTEGHVSDPEEPSADIRLSPGGPPFQDTDSETLSQNMELNDHGVSSRVFYETPSPGEIKKDDQRIPVSHSPLTGHEHHHQRTDPHVEEDTRQEAPAQPHYTNQGLVPIHYLMDVMMSHLQPVLDSFNLTLARLSEEVKSLQSDMANVLLGQMIQGESKGTGGETSELKQHEDRLTEAHQQLEELRWQLNLQRDEMEEKLHAQQTMLLYNMTNLKTDTDVKIKRNQKMLQMGLHTLNSSVSEVQEKQDQLEEELQKVWTATSMLPTPGQPHDDTAIWEAITRLDNKVVSNTVSLSTVNEDQLHISENIKTLQRAWRTLDERINKTDRQSADRSIEAALEVDGAKLALQNYAAELATNFTTFQTTLQEMEVDVDYLYTQFYKNISASSKDCDCNTLSISVEQLKLDVANVAMLANDNRLLIDTEAEERLGTLDDGGWRSAVQVLSLDLQNIHTSLALEQDKHRTLQQNLTTVLTSLLGSQLDIEALQQQEIVQAGKIRELFSKFESLLEDAVRHTRVLEVLLGEEVLEFMLWPPAKQDAHSIPALIETIKDIQQQISKHSQSLASMLNSDMPSDVAVWTSESFKTEQEQKSNQKPLERNVFALEKTVDQLKDQVVQLEQRCVSCRNCTAAGSKDVDRKLQGELTSVRKSLEDHLKVFSSIFSNTEALAESKATLNLDKLSELLNSNEGKNQRKREKKRANTREAQRRKRHESLQTAGHRQLPDRQLTFLASSRYGMNRPDTIAFETTSINRGQTYSPDTGVFKAPNAGVYLFIMTLDFGSGDSLAHLMRGEKVAASLYQSQRNSSEPVTRLCLLELQQGEEVRLELVQGSVKPDKPEDTTFAGLLLLQTT